jgi:hypothetical protein
LIPALAEEVDRDNHGVLKSRTILRPIRGELRYGEVELKEERWISYDGPRSDHLVNAADVR